MNHVHTYEQRNAQTAVLDGDFLQSLDFIEPFYIENSAHDGNLLSEPEIITRGFIYVKESGDLMKELQSVARDAAENVSRKRGRDDGELKGSVKSAVSSYLFKTTKRNPMVIPVVTRL